MKKLSRFTTVEESMWKDWKWQIKNRLTNSARLKDFFPEIDPESEKVFENYCKKFRLALTPYTLSLIETDARGNPRSDDPIWNQSRFLKPDEIGGDSEYDGVSRNWENPSELPTPILQHKYPDRAIVRLTNACFGHCNYCYLTARVLDKDTAASHEIEVWDKSLLYLRNNPQIRDVLISGGDPLVFDNRKIGSTLRDLSEIPSLRSIRLNTRALSYNPYRFDSELIDIFKQYRLTVLEIHLAHPNEITQAFDSALALFEESGYRPMILWRSPLLRGINDSVEVLEELLTKLYERRITPYYLFHYAPFSLGRTGYGVSVRRGCELLTQLRRRIPGPAFPRYTLFHIDGKQDIPLEPEGNTRFRYERDANGRPVIRFLNWKNRWVEYPDIVEPESTE